MPPEPRRPEPAGPPERRGRPASDSVAPAPAPTTQPVQGSPRDEAPARFLLAAAEAGGPAEHRKRQAAPAVPVLRLLEEPKIRAQLGLSQEQETQIFTLTEKAKNLRERIREDVPVRLREGKRKPSEVNNRARRQEFAEAFEEAMQAARADFEAIAKAAEAVLNAEQLEKLRMIGREHARLQRASGGLAILITPPARERLGLSDEQVEKIKGVLKGLDENGRDKLREGTLRDARAKIMDILTPEQRDKAERILTERKPFKEEPTGKKRGPPPVPTPTKGYAEAI